MLHVLTRWKQRRQARRHALITPERAQARAARGAAYLDRIDPAWPHRLDARTLELADGSCCVLGQIYGEFRMGLTRARILDLSSAPLSSSSPYELGFQCTRHAPAAVQARDYDYLNEAWRQEILRRTAVAPEQPGATHPARSLMERV